MIDERRHLKHEVYMRMAQQLARLSTCRRLSVGAVLLRRDGSAARREIYLDSDAGSRRVGCSTLDIADAAEARARQYHRETNNVSWTKLEEME